MTEPVIGLPLSEVIESKWIPSDHLLPQDNQDGVFDRIFVTRYESIELQEPIIGGRLEVDLTIAPEAVFDLPGLDGFSLVFGGLPALVSFALEVTSESFQQKLSGSLRIRFPQGWLRPVVKQNSKWTNDPNQQFSEVAVNAEVIIDADWNVTFDGPNEFTLAPSMIADTGFVIEGTVALDFSENESLPETLAMSLGESWRGVVFKSVTVHLPDDLDVEILPDDLTFTNFHIGSGGISGSVNGNWSPTVNGTDISGPGAGTLFGMPFGLTSTGLELIQNAVTGIEIKGVLVLPFFEAAIDVELAIDLDGNISVMIDNDSGLAELSVSSNSVELMDLEVSRLTVERLEGVVVIGIGGSITPRFGEPQLDWPTFELEKLSIDSNGNVRVDGGWLDLPSQFVLDFHSFQIEITKLGFGKTEDGGKWIGFSGGIKLIEGMTAGASVEGLRIIWYDDRDTRITLNGVGVEFEVPNVMRFKGEVAYFEPEPDIHRFNADIKLELLVLDLTIDSELVIGWDHSDSNNPYNFLAIYLAVELPAGIPLGPTGLGLYGMAGLFALRMVPDKQEDEPWYGMGPSEGWYKRPDIGVTDLTGKWDNRQGGLGLGAGITFGTVADSGFMFSSRSVLVLTFPGPIILLEGKANMMRRRSQLDKEPMFRSLAVIDIQAASLLIGLDAKYKLDENNGRLIDISGSAEVFFSFTDASDWHIYLGKDEPRDMRIQAPLFGIFSGAAYLMLDPSQVKLGAWIGFDKNWKFGRLGLTLEAWLESNVLISWRPMYFYGDLWAHGKIEVKVFSFEIGLSLDALLAARVFDPYQVTAELEIRVNLPWPLPDFKPDLTLEWEDKTGKPPLPLPLKEIAIEHFKGTTSWPLPRGELHLPNYDKSDDFLNESADTAVETPSKSEIPVVPLDCRPHITFNQSIFDEALAGVNPQSVCWTQIGDPDNNEGPVSFRHVLKQIRLQKIIGNGENWLDVAWAPHPDQDDASEDSTKLFGSWAPVPLLPEDCVTEESDSPVANVKLWLWSKNPFDWTRHTGRAWDEWFTEHFPNYPCIPIPADQEFCYDFEGFNEGTQFGAPWGFGAHPDEPKLGFLWYTDKPVPTITKLTSSIDSKTQALAFSETTHIGIWLPQAAKKVRITVVQGFFRYPMVGATLTVTAYNNAGEVLDSDEEPPSSHQEIILSGTEITVVIVTIDWGGGSTSASFPKTSGLLEVCFTTGLSDDEIIRREEMAQHLIDEMARWSQVGDVLEPHTTYRLKVVTEIELEGPLAGEYDSDALTQTEYAYFRTEGPPGLVNLTVPKHHPNPVDFDSGLNDLQLYVDQTVPATVPAVGELLPLPRPVYRAYDVGVVFNEDYVDLMYRIDHRDLGLYLFDNNNRPVRDAEGRLIVLSNRWGEAEELTLSESAEYWIETVNASTCATLDVEMIPFNKSLTSAASEQVLDPDTVYEAHLVPLLLHEDFSDYEVGTIIDGPDGTLGRWQVHDQGTSNAPSHWNIEGGKDTGFYIVQTSNITGGSGDIADPVQPGTMLFYGNNPNLADVHLEQPRNWTDYRLSVYLRSADNDWMGVVFRYQSQNNHYLFLMTRQGKYRRLIRVVKGTYTILAEDDFVYREDQDYLITIEAIGSSLRVHQDNQPVFSVLDESLESGTIGFYCKANTGSRFSDARVDDFRQQAPIVYRFKFTTSQFANFFHHLHSFQDEIWLVDLAPGDPTNAVLSELVDEAVSPVLNPANLEAIAIQDAEARAYETLVEPVLGSAALQNPPELQVTRVVRNGTVFAMLVQSPEPIDWQRTTIQVLRAQRSIPAPKVPGAMKLTDVSFGTNQPNEESVSLLLRQAKNLTGHRIEYRQLPGPVTESGEDPILFVDEFEGESKGLVFQETFGPNALDRYTIVDEGTNLAPSSWEIMNGHIVQTSNIYGGNLSGDSPNKPGTLALTGSPKWNGVQIVAQLRSADSDGTIGIVFRYQNNNNFYRFSLGGPSSQGHRRLLKKVNGTFSVLWQDEIAYQLNHAYKLVIVAYDNELLGYINNVLMFSVIDSDIKAGQVGYYCSANEDAHFEALTVETMEARPVLWQPQFADLSELEIIDEEGAIQGPSDWTVEGGMLVQHSNIHVLDDSPHRPGTFAFKRTNNFQDIQISARLRSEQDDDIGLMFRVSPQVEQSGEEIGYSYYRFSMNHEANYRRLVKKVGDVITVLWQDKQSYTVGHNYQLTLFALGNELRGYLDGILLFTAYDSDLKSGGIAFYSWANTGVFFDNVLVTNQTRRLGRWTIHDETPVSVPSIWRTAQGKLLQTANTRGNPKAQISAPGTYAIAGNPAWTDCRLAVQMRSDDNDGIGLIYRYQNNDNYYRFSIDKQREKQRFIVKNNGVVSVLWEHDGAFVQGKYFSLTLDAIGPRLVGYMGDVRLFDITDDTHSRGQIGVYSYANTGIQIDRVEVHRPPLEAYALLRDRFYEGDISDWEFVDVGTISAPSNWEVFEEVLRQTSNIHSKPTDTVVLSKLGTQAVAGGLSWGDVVVSVRLQSLEDNDVIGLMFRYIDENNYYSWSMDRDRQNRRLVKNVGGTFTLLWEDKFTYELGQIYEFTVIAVGSILRGYIDGVPVFVVDDGDLPTGRIALYCWAHEDARFSQVRVYPADRVFNDWLLNESFAYLDSTRWSFVDEGNQQGPSQWSVSEGVLIQTSNIHGGSNEPSELNKPGTYALAGDKTWTDYRTIVRLRSSEDDGIGVMFRYLDEGHYYRCSMNRNLNYIRLIKQVNGIATLLDEKAFHFIQDRDYILTTDCIGDRIVVFLDGIRIFSVEDSDLSTGCIGLYCWANRGAYFAEVKVAPPVWAPYYTFGKEKRLPAGTRFQVHAGSITDASTAESGVIQRFKAALDEHGQLRLPAEGADLRILSSGTKKSGHAREFLPEDSYTPVAQARVLRKADGTGFFIMIPSDSSTGSELVSGQYRLKLTYRRNNKAVDSNSKIFSQVGNSDSELVTVDIPWE